jgi:hypothetical protein
MNSIERMQNVQCLEDEYLRSRPGKVALSSGWKSRSGKVGRRRVASPWREGNNPRFMSVPYSEALSTLKTGQG